jgi:hypothetical protein
MSPRSISGPWLFAASCSQRLVELDRVWYRVRQAHNQSAVSVIITVRACWFLVVTNSSSRVVWVLLGIRCCEG